MPRIKILHLITTLDTGGGERSLQRLLSGMDRDAFDNSVVSLIEEGPVAPLIRALGIPVRSLGMHRGVPSVRGMLRLRSILREQRPSILQTWLYHADLAGLVASRLAPVPRLLWNVRCSEMDMRQYPMLSRATRRALAMTSRIPDAVIVNSQAGRLVHERCGYAPRRWELIPNGIDASVFARDEAGAASLRGELGIGPDVPVVGTAGRFDAMKDYATFLAAAAKVRTRRPSVRVVMAGRGLEPDNAVLAHMIAAAGLDGSVSLLGERSDVPRVLSAFDVFCLSSIGEGFPNVVAEAMACEVPVVATDVGDAAWITGAGGVPPSDPQALAAAIDRVLEMTPAMRRAQGVANRERIQRDFALRRMTEAYESLYRELAL